MDDRLYYRDSFLREFDAHVISCERAQGEKTKGASHGWWVILEHSAFYPTSGGQPHDTGHLGEAAVLDVFEREDGSVVHVTDRELAPGPVRGSINWERRFDHMQQHSGSHVLTAAFQSLFDMTAVSFHMGKALCTLDVATSSISPEQLEKVEHCANDIIFEDRPIHVRYGTAADLAALGVQKESEREGILRAVEIQGVDIQPCGGTHVCRTGQIGMILVRRIKKVRENWRVEFVCGQRARKVARADFAHIEEISQRLTCGPEALQAGITRIVNERNAASRTSERYLEEAAALQAKILLAKEHMQHLAHYERIVTGILPDADAEYLRCVAANIVAEDGAVALLGSEANGFIVMAKSEGVAGDMNAILREAVKACGGKGGGTKDFAQGSVPPGSNLNYILMHAAERASNQSPALHVVAKRSARARSQSEFWRAKDKARG